VLQFAHGPGRPESGALEDAALAQALDEYLSVGLRRLASVQLSARGQSYRTIYDAILDPAIGEGMVDLAVTDPPAAGPSWEFLRPVRRVELFQDGTAQLYLLNGNPQRAVARLLLREVSTTRGSRPSGLVTLPEAFAQLRSAVCVPFRLALLLYLSDERIRYEIDLTEDVLLKDPRAGRTVGGRKLRRPPRVSWALDQWVASGSVPLGDARILELLAEMRSASLQELSLVLGGATASVRRSLTSLAERGLVHPEPVNGQYRVRLEALRTLSPPAGGSAGAGSSAPFEGEVSALQKEVDELVASADASATCPVCGDQLPAGHTGLVCARCAAAVSQGPGGT
jgi:hypothetical protein